MARHVCPVWVAYLLASPIRRLLQNPEKIVGPYLAEGMTVVDFGCAFGFFTLPMAKMVGPKGRVIGVDLQEAMLTRMRKRAAKAGLSDRIEAYACPADAPGLQNWEGKVDFVLAMAVIHEVPDQECVLGELQNILKPGGRLLIAEPRGHVSKEKFEATAAAVKAAGLSIIDRPVIPRSLSLLALAEPESV